MSQAITLFLALASMAILGSWCPAHAAPGNDVEQTQETGAKTLDVAYIPTPQHVVDLMLVLARVKKEDVLYDLGCGDGRIVLTAAKQYGCRALGVDIDPARVRESLHNVKEADLENLITIRQQDIFELDLSEADVVTMYLTPKLNVRLIPQLEKMKPGSRIVSHDWDMLGVEPDTVVIVSNRSYREHKIYLWEVPLNKEPIIDDPPIIDDDPPIMSRPLSGVWTYTSQHAYQRILLVVVIASLGMAAFLGAAQARRRDQPNKRPAE